MPISNPTPLDSADSTLACTDEHGVLALARHRAGNADHPHRGFPCAVPDPIRTAPPRPTTASRWEHTARCVHRPGRQGAVALIGTGLLAAGLILLVLPGPGLLVIAVGLAVLAREFTWAAGACDRCRALAEGPTNRLCSRRRSATTSSTSQAEQS